MNVKQVLREACIALPDSSSPKLDADLLLAQVLGRSRTWLHSWPEHVLDIPQLDAFRALVARRAAGEPVAYMLGVREFYGREFRVTPDTLIPRPETEILVEAVLAQLPARQITVVDLGTGSGAIGITLALERPRWKLILVDNSSKALAVARDNAARLGAGNVSFLQSCWLQGNRRSVDAIVSNPPYIDPADPHLRQGDLRFEPRSALVAEEQGLADFRLIAEQARRHLPSWGWLALEHGHDQAEAVAAILEQHGYLGLYNHLDLAGHVRVTMGHV